MILNLPDHRPLSRAEKVQTLWPEGIEVVRAIAMADRTAAAAFARAALNALGEPVEPAPDPEQERPATPAARGRAPVTDGVG